MECKDKSCCGRLCPTVSLALIVIGISTVVIAVSPDEETNEAKPQVVERASTVKTNMKSSKEELKSKLSPEQYHVTQENGTERAFSNEYWNNKKQGIYVDVVSGEPLFSSIDKFESGSGWPSFTRALEDSNIVKVTDTAFGMVRTEVRSKNADSHLGHLFPDGPKPTGNRYCINSAALRFVPVEKLKEEGYEKFLTLFNEKLSGEK